MIFEHPEMLFLFLTIPILFYVRHLRPGRGGRFSGPVSIWLDESFFPGLWLTRALLFLSHLVFWGAFIALIFSLSGPARTEREKVFLSRGIDMMIVLDSSLSMVGLDYEPLNRFETAKVFIGDFLETRENDPIGLVTYAEEAALRVPPTLDYDYFQQTLNETDLRQMGNRSSIGMGIAVAALHLQNSSAARKVIIVLSDGESNSGEIPPDTAVDLASQLGIIIYTIGIGREGEVPYDYRDPDTGEVVRRYFLSTYDPDLLKRTAEATGGTFYPAPTPGSLNESLSKISTIETTERRFRIEIHTYQLYRQFLAAALLLFLLDLLIRKLFLKEILP